MRADFESKLRRIGPRQLVAPGDDVRAGHGPKLLRPGDAGEPHEVADRVLVGAPGAAVGDVGKPFDLGRDLGQALKLGGGQQPLGRDDWGRQLGVGVGSDMAYYILDKIC